MLLNECIALEGVTYAIDQWCRLCLCFLSPLKGAYIYTRVDMNIFFNHYVTQY